MVEKILNRCRGPIGVDTETRASQPHVLTPAERRRLLNGNPGGHFRRQDTVPILPTLLLKESPGRHAHDSRVDSLPFEFLIRFHTEGHFAPGSQQQHFGFAVLGISQDIRSFGQATGRRIPRPVQRRNGLPRQDQDHRLTLEFHNDPPRFHDFIGIPGPDHHEIGNGAQRRQVLDGLMRRPIFAKTDRIMRKHVNHGDLHHGRKADGRSPVIAEDQKPGAIGTNFRERHPAQNRTHRVFPNAEMQIASPFGSGLKISGPLERQERFGGRRQICRTANQPGDFPGNGIEDFSGRRPARHALGVRRKFRQFLVPAFRELAAFHFRQLIRQFRIFLLVRAKHGCPGVSFGLPSRSDA